ncbi:hypothetical protein [Gottfriedia acidiceleris]|nr:hypothetical protein [Gottfriedia acidiceleris]
MTKIPDNGGMVIFSISFSHEVTFIKIFTKMTRGFDKIYFINAKINK